MIGSTFAPARSEDCVDMATRFSAAYGKSYSPLDVAVAFRDLDISVVRTGEGRSGIVYVGDKHSGDGIVNGKTKLDEGQVADYLAKYFDSTNGGMAVRDGVSRSRRAGRGVSDRLADAVPSVEGDDYLEELTELAEDSVADKPEGYAVRSLTWVGRQSRELGGALGRNLKRSVKGLGDPYPFVMTQDKRDMGDYMARVIASAYKSGFLGEKGTDEFYDSLNALMTGRNTARLDEIVGNLVDGNKEVGAKIKDLFAAGGRSAKVWGYVGGLLQSEQYGALIDNTSDLSRASDHRRIGFTRFGLDLYGLQKGGNPLMNALRTLTDRRGRARTEAKAGLFQTGAAASGAKFFGGLYGAATGLFGYAKRVLTAGTLLGGGAEYAKSKTDNQNARKAVGVAHEVGTALAFSPILALLNAWQQRLYDRSDGMRDDHELKAMAYEGLGNFLDLFAVGTVAAPSWVDVNDNGVSDFSDICAVLDRIDLNGNGRFDGSDVVDKVLDAPYKFGGEVLKRGGAAAHDLVDWSSNFLCGELGAAEPDDDPKKGPQDGKDLYAKRKGFVEPKIEIVDVTSKEAAPGWNVYEVSVNDGEPVTKSGFITEEKIRAQISTRHFLDYIQLRHLAEPKIEIKNITPDCASLGWNVYEVSVNDGDPFNMAGSYTEGQIRAQVSKQYRIDHIRAKYSVDDSGVRAEGSSAEVGLEGRVSRGSYPPEREEAPRSSIKIKDISKEEGLSGNRWRLYDVEVVIDGKKESFNESGMRLTPEQVRQKVLERYGLSEEAETHGRSSSAQPGPSSGHKLIGTYGIGKHMVEVTDTTSDATDPTHGYRQYVVKVDGKAFSTGRDGLTSDDAIIAVLKGRYNLIAKRTGSAWAATAVPAGPDATGREVVRSTTGTLHDCTRIAESASASSGVASKYTFEVVNRRLAKHEDGQSLYSHVEYKILELGRTKLFTTGSSNPQPMEFFEAKRDQYLESLVNAQTCQSVTMSSAPESEKSIQTPGQLTGPETSSIHTFYVNGKPRPFKYTKEMSREDAFRLAVEQWGHDYRDMQMDESSLVANKKGWCGRLWRGSKRQGTLYVEEGRSKNPRWANPLCHVRDALDDSLGNGTPRVDNHNPDYELGDPIVAYFIDDGRVSSLEGVGHLVSDAGRTIGDVGKTVSGLAEEDGLLGHLHNAVSPEKYAEISGDYKPLKWFAHPFVEVIKAGKSLVCKTAAKDLVWQVGLKDVVGDMVYADVAQGIVGGGVRAGENLVEIVYDTPTRALEGVVEYFGGKDARAPVEFILDNGKVYLINWPFDCAPFATGEAAGRVIPIRVSEKMLERLGDAKGIDKVVPFIKTAAGALPLGVGYVLHPSARGEAYAPGERPTGSQATGTLWRAAFESIATWIAQLYANECIRHRQDRHHEDGGDGGNKPGKPEPPDGPPELPEGINPPSGPGGPPQLVGPPGAPGGPP